MRPRITIVTGSPGSGKTTFSRLLAREEPRGIHLVSDRFYEFPAHPVDPTRPESQEQNTVIIRALACAAGSFASDGWPVVLDGVLGPWFLDVFRTALPAGMETEYVVLAVSLEEALQRVRARDGAGASGKVEHMHAAFADPGTYAGHVLDAAGTPEATLEAFLEARGSDRFRLEET